MKLISLSSFGKKISGTSFPVRRLFCLWLLMSMLGVASTDGAEVKLFGDLEQFVRARENEFDQISDERKEQLGGITRFVEKQRQADKVAALTFICTHNSRRSHMSQLWAEIAAARFGIEGVQTYSGGTEVTAFNPRAVASLERAGLKIEKLDDANNPKYSVTYAEGGEAQTCFSKVYSTSPNPTEDFCAVMTCSSADANCPLVSGASARVSIPYEDPKVADGTPGETAKYDERCAQIAREMLYAFSQVK